MVARYVLQKHLHVHDSVPIHPEPVQYASQNAWLLRVLADKVHAHSSWRLRTLIHTWTCSPLGSRLFTTQRASAKMLLLFLSLSPSTAACITLAWGDRHAYTECQPHWSQLEDGRMRTVMVKTDSTYQFYLLSTTTNMLVMIVYLPFYTDRQWLRWQQWTCMWRNNISAPHTISMGVMHMDDISSCM